MGLDAIGIVSENPAKSVEFYALLGVKLKRFEQSEHYEAVTESGLRIMVDSVSMIKSLYPDWSKPKGSSAMALCFKKVSPKEVDETVKSVQAAGFTVLKEPWDAFWGQRYAAVVDPDGNQIDIFASL